MNTGGANRPDQVAPTELPSGQRSIYQYFNIAAFVAPANNSFRFGNAGRNTVRGPSLSNFDFSLFKNFKIREQIKLQFRGEFFNVVQPPELRTACNAGRRGNPRHHHIARCERHHAPIATRPEAAVLDWLGGHTPPHAGSRHRIARRDQRQHAGDDRGRPVHHHPGAAGQDERSAGDAGLAAGRAGGAFRRHGVGGTRRRDAGGGRLVPLSVRGLRTEDDGPHDELPVHLADHRADAALDRRRRGRLRAIHASISTRT